MILKKVFYKLKHLSVEKVEYALYRMYFFNEDKNAAFDYHKLQLYLHLSADFFKSGWVYIF